MKLQECKKGWGDKKWTWWEAVDRAGSLHSSPGSSGARRRLQEAAECLSSVQRGGRITSGRFGALPPDPWCDP